MKVFFYIALFLITSVGVYGQENTQQSISESSKATAAKVSEELNFDDSESMYLWRAIYSTEQSKQRAAQQLAEQSEQLKEMNKKIDDQFVKMLKAKFSDTEIVSIQQILDKQK